MKLDDMHAEWETDAQVDVSRIDVVNRNIPYLHAKWWRLYTEERRRGLALRQELATLRGHKMDWFLGRMDDATREELGWPPQPIRIVRQEVEHYLSTDADLLPLATKVDHHEIKIKFLEGVLRSIEFRGQVVRNHMEWLRFSQGQD